jgi:hypothetical protein
MVALFGDQLELVFVLVVIKVTANALHASARCNEFP